MIGLEWLWRKARLSNVVRIADAQPHREPADGDVQRVAAAVTRALDERDPIPASMLGGVTVAQATPTSQPCLRPCAAGTPWLPAGAGRGTSAVVAALTTPQAFPADQQ